MKVVFRRTKVECFSETLVSVANKIAFMMAGVMFLLSRILFIVSRVLSFTGAQWGWMIGRTVFLT